MSTKKRGRGRQKLPVGQKKQEVKVYLDSDDIAYIEKIKHRYINSNGRTNASTVLRTLLRNHKVANGSNREFSPED